MIFFEQVTKSYPDMSSLVFEKISFHVEPGQLYFLTGESGSGKTTLLKLLLRDIEPDSGKILVNGQNILAMRRSKVPFYRRQLGFVFQDYKLIPQKTVYHNVALPKIITGAKEIDVRRFVLMALRMVGLDNKYDYFPEQLSGGEQQRVSIARAIVNNPYVLLADEPTGNLDPQNAKEIMKLFECIQKELGTTVLIATHDKEAIADMEYPRLNLGNGKIWVA